MASQTFGFPLMAILMCVKLFRLNVLQDNEAYCMVPCCSCYGCKLLPRDIICSKYFIVESIKGRRVGEKRLIPVF